VKRSIDLNRNVWAQVDQCIASGLYGETMDDAVLALIRPGLLHAMSIGILKPIVKAKRKE
jgi:hypothetical protein